MKTDYSTIIEKLDEDIKSQNLRKLIAERYDFESKNNQLPKENQELKKRIRDLESGSIRPFTFDSFTPEVNLCDLERQYIISAMKHFSGNKSEAAKSLGITIKTLYNKLHEYGVLETY